MKRCNKCLGDKDASKFSKRSLSKDGLNTWCKDCVGKQGASKSFIPVHTRNKQCRKCNLLKSSIDFNKDKRKQDGLETRCKSCNQLRSDNNKYKKRYGITLPQVETLHKKQEYKCAICKTDKPNKRNTRFNVDHCHNAGKVRGLLCDNCNRGLGSFKDSPELLEKAIKYVNKEKL